MRFDDVLGIDEVKEQVQIIVEYLTNPGKFEAMGAKMPKGVLLSGEPGTGKTLLAKAIAGEAGVPFFYACGSNFEEVFVGVGARRIRDLFGSPPFPLLSLRPPPMLYLGLLRCFVLYHSLSPLIHLSDTHLPLGCPSCLLLMSDGQFWDQG